MIFMQKKEELERLNHLLKKLTLLENQYDEVIAKEIELDKTVCKKFKEKRIISVLIRMMQNKEIPNLQSALNMYCFRQWQLELLSKIANMTEEIKAIENEISGIDIGSYNYNTLANIKSDLFYVTQNLSDIRSGIGQAQEACEKAESEARAMRTYEEKRRDGDYLW